MIPLPSQVNSIYSNSCAHQGSSRMDQLPYYVVVSKLEAQNSGLVSEQREFREQLGQQQSMLDDLTIKLQVSSDSSVLHVSMAPLQLRAAFLWK